MACAIRIRATKNKFFKLAIPYGIPCTDIHTYNSIYVILSISQLLIFSAYVSKLMTNFIAFQKCYPNVANSGAVWILAIAKMTNRYFSHGEGMNVNQPSIHLSVIKRDLYLI